MKWAFKTLRNNAKRRGKVFTLAFEDFETFAIQTGYDRLHGKTKKSLTIHRKDNCRGYERGNIQAVSMSLHSRLHWANIPGYLKAEMIAAEEAARAAVN